MKNADDLKDTNLFVGKIINDRNVICEVIEVHKTNIKVKILQINWEHLSSYLDVNKVYPVYKHKSIISDDTMQIWEIAPKHMKRDSSQVLLYWERNIGWSWDIDS